MATENMRTEKMAQVAYPTAVHLGLYPATISSASSRNASPSPYPSTTFEDMNHPKTLTNPTQDLEAGGRLTTACRRISKALAIFLMIAGVVGLATSMFGLIYAAANQR
ncbi:Uu.00g107980.m01.CDS01 [Anthostomella pinea]|uniref:Uu.00g107980.m01.CDS01 n=1 Tax=Anthostomella pinea TaxID=933095 RepID=A0AAI8YG21_9PEZI|nr:Uu.00g107980.m01.CDS01 [Anthostomella pinea]